MAAQQQQDLSFQTRALFFAKERRNTFVILSIMGGLAMTLSAILAGLRDWKAGVGLAAAAVVFFCAALYFKYAPLRSSEVPKNETELARGIAQQNAYSFHG